MDQFVLPCQADIFATFGEFMRGFSRLRQAETVAARLQKTRKPSLATN